MKNKLSVLLAGAVLTMSLASTSAFALNDDEGQQAKESRLVLKDSLQNFHQQSEILMMEDDFNEQAFIDLQSQYQDSFAQMALIKAQTKHRFIALLTEEQKAKMKSRRATEKRRPHHFE
jgi:protein CpxP